MTATNKFNICSIISNYSFSPKHVNVSIWTFIIRFIIQNSISYSYTSKTHQLTLKLINSLWIYLLLLWVQRCSYTWCIEWNILRETNITRSFSFSFFLFYFSGNNEIILLDLTENRTRKEQKKMKETKYAYARVDPHSLSSMTIPFSSNFKARGSHGLPRTHDNMMLGQASPVAHLCVRTTTQRRNQTESKGYIKTK